MNQDQLRQQAGMTYTPQSYYGMQGYPQATYYPTQQQMPQQKISDTPGMLPVEESYVENILRLNKGKLATVYMTFENNERWNAKIFKGIIEAAGRDHIVLSDPETNKRYILLMVYLDYITFDEEIEYDYPYNQQLANYAPR